MELTFLFKSLYWHLQVQALHNKKKYIVLLKRRTKSEQKK